MGFATDRQFRTAPPPEGTPHHVGAMAGDFSGPDCTATVVVATADGQWEYGLEVEIHVIPNSCQELPISGETLLFWSGIEISTPSEELKISMGVPKGKHKPDKDGWFVVASLAMRETPARPLGWRVCAPLRGYDGNKTKEQRLEMMRQSWQSGKQLRDLPWDPFLQASGKYVARLNDPMRLQHRNGTDLGNGLVRGRAAKGIEDTVWHFGICSQRCLESFGLAWEAKPPDESYAVRTPGANGQLLAVPQFSTPNVEQASAWHSLAGRCKGDGISLATMLWETRKHLAGGKAEWE